jgi:hypothetical protein
MKILSPRVHGYLDYGVVALLLLAPTLFGFAGAPATICYVLAVAQAGMSLLTAYPLSIAKIVPFSIHGAVEALTSVFLLASPWIFNFSHVLAARNFFIASAVMLGIVWLVTDYRASYAATTSHGVRYGSERHSFS